MSNSLVRSSTLILIAIYKLFCFTAEAQIVIADQYLEEAIQMENLDTNNDGLIQQSEADELLFLTLSNVPFREFVHQFHGYLIKLVRLKSIGLNKDC